MRGFAEAVTLWPETLCDPRDRGARPGSWRPFPAIDIYVGTLSHWEPAGVVRGERPKLTAFADAVTAIAAPSDVWAQIS